MNTILDFLSFKILITPYLLIYSYAFGTLFIPILSWLIALKIKRKFKFFSHVVDQSAAFTVNHTQLKHKIWIYLLALFIFISLEIIWRVMFEFMAAYFQMHQTLINLN